MRIVGICSGGGHLTELKMVLRHLPPCVAVLTEEEAATRNSSSDLTLLPLCDPHRSFLKFSRNALQALRYLVHLRPSVVVSTGAGMAVPFFLLARVFGATCIFIETGARLTTPSTTGRLLYYFSHLFIVQKSDLLKVYQKATVASILPDRFTES
jgi:UDP-N-acetylglucosamine:LPS N-acetylglucosamine transferase